MSTKKKSENIYEIEKEGKMLVPGIVFASEELFIQSEAILLEVLKMLNKLTGDFKNQSLISSI